MKIYTKQGDKGTTAVYTSSMIRLDKDDILLDCYGTLDELNSYVGLSASSLLHPKLEEQKNCLLDIQKQLFAIGFALSDTDQLEALSLSKLEENIDELQAKLSPQTTFILPGGCTSAAHLHVARTITRRAERKLVSVSKHYQVSELALAYINRLSDYLFVLARYSNQVSGVVDISV